MSGSFLPQRGNYRNLLAFKKAECIYDITFYFCNRYLRKGDRTIDQMIQAARSGKQNIAEGSSAAATSRETEIKLFNVAKASLQELLLDYEDYLRVRGLQLWEISSPRLARLRDICKLNNEVSYYSGMLAKCDDEMICNMAVTMIHQADHLLLRLIEKAKQDFLRDGGIREQMTRARLNYRNRPPLSPKNS